MKKIFIVFLFGINSFLYGLDIDLFSSSTNMDFIEKDGSNYGGDTIGEMKNNISYGVELSHEYIFDIRYEDSGEFRSLDIEFMPFVFSSNDFMQDLVLGYEENNYKLFDGTYPIDFEQKSISVGFHGMGESLSFVYGLVYREDEESINQNGNLVTVKKDNIGLQLKFGRKELIWKNGIVTEGFGILFDNYDLQATNETFRFKGEFGGGYKFADSLVYLKLFYSSETGSSSQRERKIYKYLLGFRQTF